MRPPTHLFLAALAVMAGSAWWGMTAASGQQLDLTRGGPIDITARDGIEWRQADQMVIARGDARAIRDNVTVTADRLTAWYRKRNSPNGAQSGKATVVQGAATQAPSAPAAGITSDPSTENNEIYRLQADGNVHIFTQTDQAWGDRATYDLDQAVLVITGRHLKLTTPNDVITARDDLEYWPQKRMAVARGDAVVVTNDAKRLAADTLVAYTTENAPSSAQQAPPPAGPKPTGDPLMSSGKLQRLEAFGHVSVRTPTDTVTGERGVYVPETGIARIAGNVQITRGQNQLNGAEADVNMKTGIATLNAPRSGRVQGLVVPNDATNKALGSDNGFLAAPQHAAPQGAKPTPGGAPTPRAGANP